MSARWQDPQPPTPSRALGLAIGIVAMLILTLMAVLYLTTDRADARALACGGPCPTVPTTGATTTGATTTAATTTTPTTIATTTTLCEDCVPTQQTAPPTTGNVGICCLQGTTPPTTAPATTVTTTATTAAPTTTVATTSPNRAVTPPPDDGALPPTEADAPVTTVAASSTDTLPVTGGSPWWLALFGVCLIALGGLAVAWRRVA